MDGGLQTLTNSHTSASSEVRSTVTITPPAAAQPVPAVAAVEPTAITPAPPKAVVATPSRYEDLDGRDQAIIDYTAMGGVDIGRDGSFRSLTVVEFANRIGYASRQSIYDRLEVLSKLDNYHDIVRGRQKYLQKTVGVLAVHKGLFLRGAKGDYQQAVAYLVNHDPDFVLPAQKIEHEAGNSWSKLLDKARQRSEEANQPTQVINIIEGQVANG